jgi:hypothetical protein
MDNHASQKLSTMSLNEARAVIWPFQELKGQAIGSLFDNGLLSLKDLGFATQRAWDWRVREAARTILLNALSQKPLETEDLSGPLNVISSERRSFAERRQLELAMIEGGIVGLMLTPLPFLIWRWFNRSTNTGNEHSAISDSTIGIIALVIVLIISIAVIFAAVYAVGKIMERLLLNRLNEQMRLYRKGQLGEERVLNVMYGVLDSKWWLFHNLELPGRRLGDLDFVLVGPHGAWSFEVKAYSGEYRNVGEQWEKRYGTRWLSVRKSPTRQARRNAAELAQLLTTHQIKQWITPVIIWANPESTVLLDNPSTDVWMLDQVSHHLKELSNERPIPEAQIQRIVEVLKEIYRDEEDFRN